MIKKVLIAEDHESANISLRLTLEELGITNPDYVFYCDDALTKIRKAMQDNEPYDLLITDLSFEEDSSRQKISGGLTLIAEARIIQTDLRILVFSAEGKPTVLETLYHKLEVDGYVRKARHDSKELKLAIEQIGDNQRYFPRHVLHMIKPRNAHDFTDFDITIVGLLAQGMRQKEIPDYLKSKNIQPSSLSSIEKRLNCMKEALEFSTNEQLVAYCRDMGIA